MKDKPGMSISLINAILALNMIKSADKNYSTELFCHLLLRNKKKKKKATVFSGLVLYIVLSFKRAELWWPFFALY